MNGAPQECRVARANLGAMCSEGRGEQCGAICVCMHLP